MFNSLVNRIRQDTQLAELLRDSGILYVAGFFSIGLTFAQQITTANLLGSADYGRLATVLSSSALILLILDVRTWELGTKLLARPIMEQSTSEISRVLSWLMLVDVVLGITAAGIMFALAQPIALHLLKAPELEVLVRMYAISVPFRMFALGVSVAVLRLYDVFGWLAIKSVAYAILRLILITGAALVGLGLQGVVVAAVVGEIANTLMIIILTIYVRRREMPGVPFLDFTRPNQFTAGLKMVGDLWITATLAGLHQQTFVPLLALWTTPAEVGLFRLGMDIAELIDKVTAPLSIVVFPKVVKSYEEATVAEFRRFMRQITFILASLAVPMTLGLIILGPVVFHDMLTGYEGIAAIVSFLAIGYGVYVVFLWVRPAIVSLGLLREQNILAVVMIIISTLALFVLAEDYGALGGAIVRGGFLSVYMALSFLLLRHGLLRRQAELGAGEPSEGDPMKSRLE